MTTEQVVIDTEGLRDATRRGLIAAAILAVLTVIEFFVAAYIENPLYPLLPFVILKGWIILDSFMHVRSVFGDGDH